MRQREAEIVAHLRKERKAEFELAERTLNVGWVIITNTTVQHPDGDAATGRIMLGLYAKILNDLLSIIVLNERGLPTATVMRTMTEGLINLAYIATDPLPLAKLYLDGIWLRHERDLNRRLNSSDPEIRTSASKQDASVLRERVAEVKARRSAEELEAMRKHGWAGNPVEQMAKKAGLPPIVYEGVYATESQSVHAMNAADFLHVDENDNLSIRLASEPRTHLVPAMAVAIYAMDVVNRIFGLKREAAVRDMQVQLTGLRQQRTTQPQNQHQA